MGLMSENHSGRLLCGSVAPVLRGRLEEVVVKNGYPYSRYLLGEYLHPTSWRCALMDFEFCVMAMMRSTLFKLAAMGSCCGCRLI